MPRFLYPLLAAGVLAAAGCRTCDDRAALFPRVRGVIDGPDDRYADRFRDRYALPAATDPCLPCAGVGGYPVGGLTGGTPVYGPPLGSPLGQPVYPGGDGVPLRPRRDDELPLPGEFSRPGAVEQGRVAPKPPGSLPVSGK